MQTDDKSRQAPTFNAPPVVEATLDAVRRGVEVVLYLDLGYNDAVRCFFFFFPFVFLFLETPVVRVLIHWHALRRERRYRSREARMRLS